MFERVIVPTPIDLAYIAGIIDGEGYIGVYGGKQKKHVLTVGVKMCDPEAIGAIVDAFGGTNSGYENEFAYVFRWVVQTGRAYEFLKAIRPYLKVKAEQADWAIEYYEETFRGKGTKLIPEDFALRDEYAQILKDLKGWQSWETAHS
jgi:hypothetical protein